MRLMYVFDADCSSGRFFVDRLGLSDAGPCRQVAEDTGLDTAPIVAVFNGAAATGRPLRSTSAALPSKAPPDYHRRRRHRR